MSWEAITTPQGFLACVLIGAVLMQLIESAVLWWYLRKK